MGWTGVDLDGTLARYGRWQGADHVGEPIAPMCDRVRALIADGKEVRIFTARVYPLNRCIHVVEKVPLMAGDARLNEALSAVKAIRQFCLDNFGRILAVTNVKDYEMEILYDDRAVQVVHNTGELVTKKD